MVERAVVTGPNSVSGEALYRFHATLHARPALALNSDARQIDSQALEVLQIEPADLAASSFQCTFENAAARLAALDRMFVEPDGSFIWAADLHGRRWQIEGNLYDRAGRLQFVDLKGECPASALDQFLLAFGWPEQQVVMQLSSHGVVVDEHEFRRWASQLSQTSAPRST